MKRKRIKKCTKGGFTPGTGFAGTGVGQGIGAFGGLAGGLIEGADMKDGYMSTGGALGSGALKGASMGAAFGPMGMLLGAGLGAAGGLMKKQEINDAEDARQRAIRDEERLRSNMENQLKHQQMNQVLDQFPVRGNTTPRFDKGGDTGGTVTPEKAMQYKNAQFKQYQPSKLDLLREAFHAHNMKDDSTFENAMEIADPTGISSWDDAYRANQSANERVGAYNADEMLDIAGAMPIFGKYKAGVSLSKNAGKKLAHDFKRSGEAALAGAKQASNYLNALDGVEDETGFMDNFELGGPTGEQYFAMPNYGGSMNPNAKPTMDFYYQGQQMAPADFIKQLPQGMDINQIAAYGMDKAQPMFDPQTGWSNVGVNDYMRSFATSQGNTPTYAMGGTTLAQYEVEGGEMMQYKQGDRPATYGKGGMSQVSSQEFEVQGPSHANGGVKASDNKGARVYSDKLRVDASLAAKLMKL